MTAFEAHYFIPYPEKHPSKGSCVKCGRKKEHELHKVENIKPKVEEK